VKPIILLVNDELAGEYRYTLKISYVYAMTEKHYKFKLTYWMLKLLWKEIWRSTNDKR